MIIKSALSVQKSLLLRQVRHLPRGVTRREGSMADRMRQVNEVRESQLAQQQQKEMQQVAMDEILTDPMFRMHEERFQDSQFEKNAELASVNLPMDRTPEDLQNRMKRVFSKHKVSDVRVWSRQLMQSYQLLHAVEKPMNLDYAKPFSNTSDLKSMTPKIFSKVA